MREFQLSQMLQKRYTVLKIFKVRNRPQMQVFPVEVPLGWDLKDEEQIKWKRGEKHFGQSYQFDILTQRSKDKGIKSLM